MSLDVKLQEARRRLLVEPDNPSLGALIRRLETQLGLRHYTARYITLKPAKLQHVCMEVFRDEQLEAKVYLGFVGKDESSHSARPLDHERYYQRLERLEVTSENGRVVHGYKPYKVPQQHWSVIAPPTGLGSIMGRPFLSSVRAAGSFRYQLISSFACKERTEFKTMHEACRFLKERFDEWFRGRLSKGLPDTVVLYKDYEAELIVWD